MFNQLTASTSIINYAPEVTTTRVRSTRHCEAEVERRERREVVFTRLSARWTVRQIISHMGVDEKSAIAMSAVIGATKLIGVGIGMLTVDSLGRKPLLIGGSVGYECCSNPPHPQPTLIVSSTTHVTGSEP
jgi:hypothetical protein